MRMNNMLFGFPIHNVFINPNSYDKETIVSNIKKNYEIDGDRNEWGSSKLHHPYGDWDNEKFIDINYNKLKEVYQKTFDNFFKNHFKSTELFNYHWNIVNYTAIKTGQYMKAHTHPEYDFSCTHYINFNPEKHSSLRFVNSSPTGLFGKEIMNEQYLIADRSHISNSYLYGDFDYPSLEDDMIIFPATLQHEVPVQKETDELRICVVTNIKLLKGGV
jgi:hypothetical protein